MLTIKKLEHAELITEENPEGLVTEKDEGGYYCKHVYGVGAYDENGVVQAAVVAEIRRISAWTDITILLLKFQKNGKPKISPIKSDSINQVDEEEEKEKAKTECISLLKKHCKEEGIEYEVHV